MQRGLPIERGVRKVSMDLRTRVGEKGWRRTLSVVTPEVAMMIDTSLNVEDDSLVAGIVSFLLSFYFSSRISFLLLKTVGGATRSRLTSSTRENECTFLSSVSRRAV